MADFTAKDVQALRQATGAGMMDAKKALEANNGDAEAAAKWLREKGLGKAAERTDRENTEGVVALAVTDAGAAIVQLKSETDFVAKSDQFKALAQDIADLVAAKGPDAATERNDAIDDLKVTLKENIELGQVVHFAPTPGAVVDSYLHVQNGRGVNAVLVELEGASQELAHDVAVHIGFAKPQYLTRDEVPAERVAEERATLETITRNEGKPEAAMEKIVEGRLNGWYKDICLVEQGYAKDDKQSIQQLIGNGKILRFAQVVVGK